MEHNKMSVLNEHGEREELEHLPTNEARRTLGVWQEADGNEKTQTAKPRKKANKWATLVARSTLKKSDIRMGVTTFLYPSLTYGLMATALSEKQAKEVFSPIREKVLPKLKVCRTAPSALVHGPTEYGGMDIKNIHTLQGIAHIKALLEEASQDTATGKLMRNLAEYHQLECGMEEYLFHLPYDLMKECMTDTWMKNTTEFASKTDIEVRPIFSPLIKWCENDSFLMSDAINAGFTGKELAAINRCRMHMKAVTLSDITSDRGSRITLEAFDVRGSDTSSMSASYYKWPPQPRPPLKDRRIRKRFLARAFNTDTGHLELNLQCSKWTRAAALQSRWTFCHDTEELYERIEDGRWKKWRPTKRQRSPEGGYGSTEYFTERLPDGVDVANVTTANRLTRVRLVNTETTLDEVSTDNDDDNSQQIKTLKEQMDSIDPSLQWLIQDIKLPEDDGSAIAQSILTGNGKCMSDGSLKDLLGTSAFTFLLDDEKNNYVGSNIVPGEDDEQNSYRSKICGVLGNMLVINATCEFHGINEPCEIMVGCDNVSALWNGLGPTPVHMKMASTDLVKVIRQLRQTSVLHWKSHWVKGHKDDDDGEPEEQTELDEWAQANIFCDKEAERAWIERYNSDG